MSIIFRTLIPVRFSLLLIAASVAGCSGSNDTASADSQLAAESDVQNLDETNSPFEIVTDTDANAPEEQTDPAIDNAIDDPQVTQNEQNEQNEQDPVSTDPLTTQVNFDITVPAYSSNALQVRLVWGTEDLSASWVGDEFWSASADLPMATESSLIVTFYDDNGDLVLGTYEAAYTTGSSDAESYQITADQFNTRDVDDDSDGLSNYAEVTAGTNPLVSESNLPDIIFSDTVYANLYISPDVLDSMSFYEEEILTLDFPINVQEESIDDNRPYNYVSLTRDINITADGVGTYDRQYYEKPGLDAPYSTSSTGTRSRQGDTVTWSGADWRDSSTVFYDGYVLVEFETSNTANERQLTQKSSGTRIGAQDRYDDVDNTTIYDFNIVLDLDSMDTENTCAVLHGVLSTSYEYFDLDTSSDTLREITLSRSSATDNWVWTRSIDGVLDARGEASAFNQRFYCNFPNR